MSRGLLMITLSKHALLRAFQMAQQIAATPHTWNFFPKGNHFSHQFQHWSKFLGIALAPKLSLSLPKQLSQHSIEKRDERYSLDTGSPFHFLFNQVIFGQNCIFCHKPHKNFDLCRYLPLPNPFIIQTHIRTC